MFLISYIKLYKLQLLVEKIVYVHGVVADILCISAAFESVSFRWIPREENTNADLLAKQVLSVNEAFMAST